MMCLGWSTKPTCASGARPVVQVGGTGTAPTQIGASGSPAAGSVATVGAAGGVTAAGAAGPCPDITWFWLAGAGILLAGLMGGGKQEHRR